MGNNIICDTLYWSGTWQVDDNNLGLANFKPVSCKLTPYKVEDNNYNQTCNDRTASKTVYWETSVIIDVILEMFSRLPFICLIMRNKFYNTHLSSFGLILQKFIWKVMGINSELSSGKMAQRLLTFNIMFIIWCHTLANRFRVQKFNSKKLSLTIVSQVLLFTHSEVCFIFSVFVGEAWGG